MADNASRRIILAEDEPASLKLLARQLEQAGYAVAACSNGREALAAIQEQSTGVVIADWMMPELDGLGLCRTIRRQYEMQTLGLVYFILLTAHCGEENIVQGLEAGADDYLTKPYHRRELLARIRAGERILALQAEALRGQMEVHKVNASLAILNDKLDKLASTDVLTGLSNRRRLFERLQAAWDLAHRHGRPLSYFMLDVDYFKRVNDQYGHEAGDRVLKQIASAIRCQLRLSDICGRFGGEEFLAALPETNLTHAYEVAERIRATIGDLTIPAGEHQVAVTVSIGVAEKRPEHATMEALIASADAMVYEAKSAGRNQVRADFETFHPGPAPTLPIAASPQNVPMPSAGH